MFLNKIFPMYWFKFEINVLITLLQSADRGKSPMEPGRPKAIVFDRDVKFTSNFWKGLFADLGTKLKFSTAYHPQIDGQTERVNQVLEDMLRMYVMDKPTKWEDYSHLVEFAYNNGHQASLGMSPYEALYGRRCRTLVI